MAEVEIGKVTDFFKKVGVAAIKLTGDLAVGDTVHIKGHTTDLTLKVESMQVEHLAVQKAGAGAEIGIKIAGPARKHDTVYKVTA